MFVFPPQSPPVLVQAYMNPVAVPIEVYHRLTDNVAESHRQGTAILLCNGWPDPVSSFILG